MRKLEELNAGHFRSRLGQPAELQADGGNLRLRLVEVKDLGESTSEASRRSPFSLLWEAAELAPLLEQGTYPVRWDGPAIELFVVPVGPGPEGGMRYEAIFN